jgi:hypothetical protein
MKKKEIFSGDETFIVVTGSPADGFEFTGPFAGYGEASQWSAGLGEAWWIEKLETPDPADFGRDH